MVLSPFVTELKHDDPTLGEVVGIMCQLAWKAHEDAKVRGLTESITRALTNNDYTGEAVAIRNWFLQSTDGKQNVRYLMDPVMVELLRRPNGNNGTLTTGQEDCDGSSMASAGMLQSIGHECWFCLAHFNGSPAPSHVFTVDKGRGHPIVIDPVAGIATKRMLGEMTRFELVDCAKGVDGIVQTGVMGMPFRGWGSWHP